MAGYSECGICYALQVVQIFLPIISTSPIANFLTSQFGSIFGQGLVSLQNIVAGMA